MKAIIFPGQGSQKAGMANEFEKNFKVVKEIFSQADEILKMNLSKIILTGSDEDLKKTEITQPAILTTSVAILNVLKNEFNLKINDIKYFAGRSLGEYTALVCSESLSYNDALYLLNERGKAMQAAVSVGVGSMIAVLGMKIDDLNNLLKSRKKDDGVCEIANDNANGQVILSGNKKSIDSFQIVLKEKKIKLFLSLA